MFANPEHAFGGTSRLLGLIERIYSAVQQPELWQGVLEEVSEALHGESMVMFAAMPDAPLVAMARVNPVAVEAYVNHYAAINLLSEACDRIFADGTTRYAHWAMQDRELEKSEFYNDFFRPNNMHHSVGVKIPLGNGIAPVYVSCQRPKESGTFDESEGLVYETLLPHLQRALSLHLQFTAMRSQKMGLETALDCMGHAVVGLDSRGRVVLQNGQAEELLAAGDAVRLVNGALEAVFHEHNRELKRLIAQTAATGTANGVSAGGAMLLARRSGGPAVRVTVTPFRSELPGRAVHVAALVFLSDPAGRLQSRSVVLTALYALTPTETRVADLVLQGLDVAGIADSLQMAEGTVRFHMKRVLAKTGTHRQAELVRMMVSLPGV